MKKLKKNSLSSKPCSISYRFSRQSQLHLLYIVSAIFAFNMFASNTFSATHHPQDFLTSIAGKKDEAKEIVKHFCATCHAPHPQIPLGAPRIGVQSDWQPRLKQGREMLFKHTNEGLGFMPARGGCFECSDQQLLKAIEYMSSH